MTRTSVICPFQNKSAYTLVELLVVLLIFSLLAGMAVPRLITMYDSVQAAYERDEILSRISGLTYQAFKQGKKFKLTHYPVEKQEIFIFLENSLTMIYDSHTHLNTPKLFENWKKYLDNFISK